MHIWYVYNVIAKCDLYSLHVQRYTYTHVPSRHKEAVHKCNVQGDYGRSYQWRAIARMSVSYDTPEAAWAWRTCEPDRAAAETTLLPEHLSTLGTGHMLRLIRHVRCALPALKQRQINTYTVIQWHLTVLYKTVSVAMAATTQRTYLIKMLKVPRS